MRFSQIIVALQDGEAGLLEHQLGSDPDLRSAGSLEKADSEQLSFLEKGNALIQSLKSSHAGAVLIPDQEDLKLLAEQRGLAWAVMRDPRLAFAEALDQLHPRPRQDAIIHPSAVIGDRVQIDSGVSIGAHVCIGDDTRIKAHCTIHPGVVIYGDVVVGQNCELHANAVLHPGVRLANYCVVHSNAVVGSEGFGFVPTSKGWRKMPQTGLVVLEEGLRLVVAARLIARPLEKPASVLEQRSTTSFRLVTASSPVAVVPWPHRLGLRAELASAMV